MSRQSFNLAALVYAAVLFAVPAAAADIAPGKFIPSAVFVYGGYNCSTAPIAQDRINLAKFDLLDIWHSAQKCWATNGLNSWKAIKQLNPNTKIVLYRLGPGEFDTDPGKSPGWTLNGGWTWMTQNHGTNAADRWTAKGITHGTYLQSTVFANERLMQLGNVNWQNYYYQQTYSDWWGGQQRLSSGMAIDADGVDGIFADNTGYYVPYCGSQLVSQGTTNIDNPVGYYSNGACQNATWKSDLNAFFNRAVPWLAARAVILVPNFGGVEGAPQLDAITSPPFAAMDECSFSCPWGSFRTESTWKAKVDAMLALRRVRAWMHNGLNVNTTAVGASRMDVAHSSGATGWDALWFDLASFLMGYDEARGNAYLSYIAGEANQVLWFDEFDPAYLHLGRAVGPYAKVQGVYMREYQDGWVVANPTTTNGAGIAVPRGRARVINHANFRQAGTAPLVTSFNLASNRGVILLKEGRLLGNVDNGTLDHATPSAPTTLEIN